MAEAAPNDAPKLVAMELKRNYRPIGDFEVVGYNRPRVVRKDTAGNEVVIHEAAFIKDEKMPSLYPGVEYPGKIWAGTIIKVPEDEGKSMRKNGIAERAFDD